MKDRLAEFDFIKGIMISLMVFGHISYVGTFKEEFKIINFLIYQFHMPVFLLMSGYFMNSKNSLWQNFKKIKYIAYLYFIFTSIYIFLLYFLHILGISTSNQVEQMTLLFFLKQVFFNPIGAYWYLHNLVIYYLFFCAVNHCFSKKNINLLIVMGIISILLLFYGDYFGFRHVSAIFLFLGMILKNQRIKFLKGFWLIVPITIILINQWMNFNPVINNNSIYRYIIYQLPTSLILTIVMIGFLISVGKIFLDYVLIRWITFLGINSLSILLFHAYFINCFKLFDQIFIKIDSSGLLYVSATTICSLLLSISISWILDFLKVSKFVLGGNKIFHELPS